MVADSRRREAPQHLGAAAQLVGHLDRPFAGEL